MRPSFAKRVRTALHETVPPKKIRGGGAPIGAYSRDRTGASDERIRNPRPVRRAPRTIRVTANHPLCGARSPFGAPSRLSPRFLRPRLSPVPRFMVADNRSAPRAASSWQTGVVAGRADFRTARGQAYEARPGHRSRSINRPSPVDVPWSSETRFFSSSRGAISNASVEASHPSDPTIDFFAVCLLHGRRNCGCAAMIRIRPLRRGEFEHFCESW